MFNIVDIDIITIITITISNVSSLHSSRVSNTIPTSLIGKLKLKNCNNDKSTDSVLALFQEVHNS